MIEPQAQKYFQFNAIRFSVSDTSFHSFFMWFQRHGKAIHIVPESRLPAGAGGDRPGPEGSGAGFRA
jgi:hypothetical protein